MPEGGTNQWSDAMVIPKNAKNRELAHAFINYASDYDGAYDNSSYVGYTSANKKVMKDLYGKGGEFEGIDAYIPRTDNKNDEVFEYNEETKKEISNLWSKVKIAASNTIKGNGNGDRDLESPSYNLNIRSDHIKRAGPTSRTAL